MKPTTLYYSLIMLSVLWPTLSVAEQPLIPPDDPRQSITYWKPHALDPGRDRRAALAGEVFSDLLRTWDDTRVAPGLFVVRSGAGPWAASLADGNILLSARAVDTCVRLGGGHARDLLAFVLAHELAHQRVDDLWHHRFFRLAGAQSPQVQRTMLRGLEDSAGIQNLERREAQADHDGLIMMATVGYDPYQVLAGKDFFTAWVETLWDSNCGGAAGAARKACAQAGSRAVRARTQLRKVADQAVLYDIGIQHLVAGRHEEARRYLKAFGRDYPGRAVYSALGGSYFMEALGLQREISSSALWDKPGLFYPLLLESTPLPEASSGHRGDIKGRFERLKRERNRLLQEAVAWYERARKLAPDHRLAYYMTALAWLMDDNTYMARGEIQGKYLARFGDDLSVQLLLAMVEAMEGKLSRSERSHRRLLKQLQAGAGKRGLLSERMFVYTLAHNMAALEQKQGSRQQATGLWQELADRARRQGDSVLFQLAVSRLRGEAPVAAASASGAEPLLDPARYQKRKAVTISSVWVEGEELTLSRYPDGARLLRVAADGRLVAAWQDGLNANTTLGGDGIDRPVKLLGIPDRQVQLAAGNYLAYDKLGMAIRERGGKVAGWFVYPGGR